MVKVEKEFEDIPQDKIPEWLNDELFRCCLESEYPSKDVQVKVQSVKPAVAVGDNYSSSMLRVKVEVIDGVESVIKSLVIKRIIVNSDPNVQKIMEDIGFAREADVYSKVLPLLENEFKNIGEDIHFGPKLYKVVETETETSMIFEDLKTKNYSTGERLKCLDLNHCEVFYKKLAKLHAASAVYREKNGLCYEKLLCSPYHEKFAEFSHGFMGGLFPHFLEMIKKNENLKHLSEKIEGMFPVHFKEMDRHTQPTSDPGEFQVLCHGDPWTNNVLYTHDENKNPTDIIFVDFQGLFWSSSPIYDIIYFYASSMELELKETAFDDILYSYHTELVKNLKKLNYSKKIPTLRDLHVDFMKKGYIGAPLAFRLMPFVLLAPREDANIDNIVADEGDLRKAMFTSNTYMKNVEAWYRFLEKKGLLDVV